jgi:cytosine/adenosine deaminase-related metal-dependent hydrolase
VIDVQNAISKGDHLGTKGGHPSFLSAVERLLVKGLPAGKVLEMVTIDSAKALGVENELGSLEPGKKADVILVDMFKPHLMPFNMPVYRVAYFAKATTWTR